MIIVTVFVIIISWIL